MMITTDSPQYVADGVRQTPRTVNTVRLLGSWDNFSKPYPMKKDSNLGSGHWRGCHSFTGIICDGEVAETPESKRDGALMQGGKYWYYYQLDNEVEFHNPKEPSTTNCPFLPGQEVNVLDVPIHVVSDRDTAWLRTGVESLPIKFTLDPEDRYRTPRPPLVSSTAIAQWTLEQSRKYKQSEKKTMSSLPEPTRRPPSPPKSVPSTKSGDVDNSQHDYVEVADLGSRTAPSSRGQALRRAGSKKLRRWASVVSRLPSRKSNKHISMSSGDVPPVPRMSFSEVQRQSVEVADQRVSTPKEGQVDATPHPPNTAGSGVTDDEEDECYLGEAIKKFPSPPTGSPAASPTRTEHAQAREDLQSWTKTPRVDRPDAGHREDVFVEPAEFDEGFYSGTEDEPPESGDEILYPSRYQDTDGKISINQSPSRSPERPCNLRGSASVASSYATSGVFSSGLSSATAQTELRTSLRLSQPLTPTFSDFGDFTFQTTSASPERFDVAGYTLDKSEFNESYLASGFNGYSLTEAESASALTIKNLETRATQSHDDDEGEPFEAKHREQIINAWSEGLGRKRTDVDELVDEVGYLRGMIR